MAPDKFADAIQRLGTLAHVWLEGDHGTWTITIGWGAAGVFRGRSTVIDDAYRLALDQIIRKTVESPGLHNLAAAVTPGILGLPAACQQCPTMEVWLRERQLLPPTECGGC